MWFRGAQSILPPPIGVRTALLRLYMCLARITDRGTLDQVQRSPDARYRTADLHSRLRPLTLGPWLGPPQVRRFIRDCTRLRNRRRLVFYECDNIMHFGTLSAVSHHNKIYPMETMKVRTTTPRGTQGARGQNGDAGAMGSFLFETTSYVQDMNH